MPTRISPELSTLRKLEERYEAAVAKNKAALEKVRSLIMMEGGKPSNSKLGSNGSTPISDMTKGGAAEHIMKEAGKPLTKNQIFDEMKRQGHPVANIQALATMMSEDNRFTSLGNGEWELTDKNP